jgi:diacylglycerol O-acyltransferase / wax synthase
MPMHVGCLLLLSPAESFKGGELRELFARAITPREYRRPFNEKVVYPPSRLGLPHWEEDKDFDLEYHVRHSALPSPGRYRELFILVSRLHGTLLDRTRPLWEWHLIEGLETGQFAVYSKFHHSLIDGVAGMRLLERSMSPDPDRLDTPMPWAKSSHPSRGPRRPGGAPKAEETLVEMLRSQLGVLPGVARACARTLGSLQRPADSRMALPFEAPRSAINTHITGARRFVAQSYGMDRIAKVKAAFGATVNDVILAMCSGALRRYLKEYGGGLPTRPLTAMAPVSVRPSDGDDFGNAVSAIFVNLATHLDDPLRRLETIQASIKDGKSLIRDLSFNEVMLYTAMLAAPAFVPTMLGLGAALPAINVVVSSVPGPKERLYWNGARLDGMYPVSIVIDGMAVNITVTSYAGSLDFGIVACRRSVPRVQRIIDFLEESLKELEDAAGAGGAVP